MSVQKESLLQADIVTNFGATLAMETSEAPGDAPISQSPLNKEPQQAKRPIFNKIFSNI